MLITKYLIILLLHSLPVFNKSFFNCTSNMKVLTVLFIAFYKKFLKLISVTNIANLFLILFKHWMFLQIAVIVILSKQNLKRSIIFTYYYIFIIFFIIFTFMKPDIQNVIYTCNMHPCFHLLLFLFPFLWVRLKHHYIYNYSLNVITEYTFIFIK